MLNQKKTINISPLVGLLMLGLFLFLMYLLFQGIYRLAYIAMPVLAIAALVIDYKVYVSYGKTLIKQFQKSWIWGIISVGLTVMLMPLVVLYLFSKSIMTRFVLKGVKNHPMFQEQKEGDYLDYVEVEDEAEEVSYIELPPVEEKPKDPQNQYDDYFK